jgi:hypothetical protein
MAQQRLRRPPHPMGEKQILRGKNQQDDTAADTKIAFSDPEKCEHDGSRDEERDEDLEECLENAHADGVTPRCFRLSRILLTASSSLTCSRAPALPTACSRESRFVVSQSHTL